MKKILVFKLDDEYVDSAGDVFTRDAQVDFDKDIPIVHNFHSDVSHTLGTAQLFREGDDFFIKNMVLSKENDIAQALAAEITKNEIYPAIGGMMKKREGDKITHFSIDMVSFTPLKNADSRIKSVREQFEETEK